MISGHLASRTWLHGVPARIKLAGLAAATIVAFWLDDWRLLLAGTVLVASVYVAMGQEARRRLRLFRALTPVLVIIAMFQYWSVGPETAAVVTLRLCLMVLLADMVSMTTPMLDMMDAMEPLFRPLKFAGLDPSRVTIAVALVLRFAPALMEEWSRRNEAWRARTGRRASLMLLPPFLASLVAMADRVAEALDARGFGRNKGS